MAKATKTSKSTVKRVGMLTGGGDCPGLNAVLRAAVRRLTQAGVECIGILEGWKGMLNAKGKTLTWNDVRDILPIGGTIIGTSRTNPFKTPKESLPKIKDTFKKLKLDALIAIGGDDTLGVANKLYKEEKLNCIGVPKTIDNDLSATDFTFGFDTAVNIAMEAFDRIQTTARSHRRVMVVECMGRHAGWITAYAGMSGSADYTLVPEHPVDIDHVCEVLKRNRAAGQDYNIVAVSEGITFKPGDFTTQEAELDQFGHVRLGGVAKVLADMIEKRTGYETRHVVLGHLQRGGTPTAFDRVLGTRYGLKAAELILSGDFGKMVALQGNKIVAVSLQEGVGKTKVLDDKFWSDCQEFFL